MAKKKDYEVGYKKPPADSRFEPGQSGNPQGRPKGTLNFATTLLKTLRERVVINENGRRKEITKLQAAVKQLVNKAASGALRALNQLNGCHAFCGAACCRGGSSRRGAERARRTSHGHNLEAIRAKCKGR